MYVKTVHCTQSTICPRCGHKAVHTQEVTLFNIGYGEEFKVPQHHCVRCGCEELDYVDVED